MINVEQLDALLWNDVTELVVELMPALEETHAGIGQWFDIKQNAELLEAWGAQVVYWGTHSFLGIPHKRHYAEYLTQLMNGQ
jgi:hypothetical protein